MNLKKALSIVLAMAEDNQLGDFAITEELKMQAVVDCEALRVVLEYYERL